MAVHYNFLQNQPAVEANKILRNHMVRENSKRGIEQSSPPVAVFKWSDEHGIIAGACGNIYHAWFCLELLWVAEAFRRQGEGAEMLNKIEAQAMRLGARCVYVWSQDFEAPGFYRKHGYQDFVQLNDFLPGHYLVGLQKKLVMPGA